MPLFRVLLPLACLGLAACAATPAPQGLAMPAPHEARAASLLAGFLLGRGWTVALADETIVVAARGPERLELQPLLDVDGLDRIIVWRAWPAAPHADPAALAALALELNATLNVGQFQAAADELRFQSSLPFLEALEPRLLDAYLEHTAAVRLAVLRVQGERQLLAPVEGDPVAR
jgi:hypothetical protein